MNIKPYNLKYKRGLEILLNRCEKEGIKVKFVKDDITKDFAAMNEYAGKAFGYPIPDDTIYIDKRMSIPAKYRTLKHELDEVHFMEKGMKYWPAHCKALKLETKVVKK